jgi:hypothetical protein
MQGWGGPRARASDPSKWADPARRAALRCAAQDADVVDSLAFRLAHPLCLVHHFDLRPFRAWFQPVRALRGSGG